MSNTSRVTSRTSLRWSDVSTLLTPPVSVLRRLLVSSRLSTLPRRGLPVFKSHEVWGRVHCPRSDTVLVKRVRLTENGETGVGVTDEELQPLCNVVDEQPSGQGSDVTGWGRGGGRGGGVQTGDPSQHTSPSVKPRIITGSLCTLNTTTLGLSFSESPFEVGSFLTP